MKTVSDASELGIAKRDAAFVKKYDNELRNYEIELPLEHVVSREKA